MESSSPLAIESFSYSWLSNAEPPLDGVFDEPLRTSLDSSKELAQNFNFDIPTSQSSACLHHADELFSDGHIKPVSAHPSKIKAPSSTSDLITVLPAGSSFSPRNVITARPDHYRLLSKWQKSSKKILRKCFGYLRPYCHKFGSSRKSNRVNDIDRTEQEVRNWSNSPLAGDWCDVENSIYEAILHCKRSVEKVSLNREREREEN